MVCGYMYRIVNAARKRLREFFTDTAYEGFDMTRREGPSKLITILFDLLKYQDDELRLSSIQLLFDIFQVCDTYPLIINFIFLLFW